jgi:hypothetical protein
VGAAAGDGRNLVVHDDGDQQTEAAADQLLGSAEQDVSLAAAAML